MCWQLHLVQQPFSLNIDDDTEVEVLVQVEDQGDLLLVFKETTVQTETLQTVTTMECVQTQKLHQTLQTLTQDHQMVAQLLQQTLLAELHLLLYQLRLLLQTDLQTDEQLQ